MNELVRVGTCKSLSGGSTLTYHIGHDENKGMMICLTENTGKGLFNKDWVSLAEVETLLSVYREPFTSKALYPAFKGKSANSSGFLMAALLEEGFVIEARGKGNGFVVGGGIAGLRGDSDEVTHGRVVVDPGQAGEG